MLELFGAILVFFVGLAVGSFLNVVMVRTSREEGVLGRSRCVECQAAIRVYDNIPVVSFFVLGGKCRDCSVPISAHYPLVELATGFLFFFFFLQGVAQGWDTLLFIRNLLFVPAMILLFVYDLRHQMILDRFTLPFMLVALGLNLWLGMSVTSMFLGAILIGGFFALQHVVSGGRWIGGGDIRMGVLMGILLGIKAGVVALIIAYVIGAFVAAFLLTAKRANRKTAMPFGTFLSLATLLVMFIGEPVLDQWFGI